MNLLKATVASIVFYTSAYSQVTLNNATGSGSGFLVSSSGYIVTNYHVIEGVKSIEAYQKNSQGKTATVVRTDLSNDIAILKIECNQCAYVNTKTSSTVRKGDKVFALGYPNLKVQGIESKLTDGVISSVSGIMDQPNNFQITNPIQPGNSGGPLFNEDGDVIGLIVATLKNSQNVNYAIKSNYYIELLNSLDSNILKEQKSTKQNKKISDTVADIDKATVLILIQEEQKTKETTSSEKSPQTPSPSNPAPSSIIPDIRKMSKLPSCAGSDTAKWNNCFGDRSYPNGNSYSGEFQGGAREGIGKIVINATGQSDNQNILSDKPATYLGQFKNNKLNGRGTIYYQNGEKITGDFVDNIIVKKY
jgi:V8-like Glu-specific endopeptidase